MKKHLFTLAAATLLAVPASTLGVVIDFAGGTAHLTSGGNVTTDNFGTFGNVDYYEENGFKVDFVPSAGSIGNYYGVGNSVIHGHWDTVIPGGLTTIRVSKIDGTTFDLNYFILTSNTQSGGGPASGNEQSFIRNNTGDDIKLPSENWGFPATQIFLPDSYDNISYFEFYVNNPVFCFGMDEFFIDEAPPEPPPGTNVPDAGSSAGMLAAGFATVAALRKRLKS